MDDVGCIIKEGSVSRLIPMKRELKDLPLTCICRSLANVSRLIPMKRELKEIAR